MKKLFQGQILVTFRSQLGTWSSVLIVPHETRSQLKCTFLL